MANEVLFFHAMRKLSIERALQKNERLYRIIQLSKINWCNEPKDEQLAYNAIEQELLDEINGNKQALEEAEEDLQQALLKH